MDAAHKGLTAVVQLLVNAKANCDMQLEVTGRSCYYAI
jgi:hypothetical protein